MRTEVVEHQADGARLVGHLAYDETREGKRPGILIVHEATGLSPHEKGRAERLAGLGFVALAMDLFGEGKRAANMEEAMRWVHELTGNPARLRARARSGLDALAAHARVDPARLGAIGYCLGGTTVLELARSGAPVGAVVSFHGGLQTAAPQDARNIKAKVLVCTGGEDNFIPPEQRQAFEREMREGGVDWQMSIYGKTKHSFTNPGADALGMEGLAYNPSADRRSWAEMLTLFEEAFAAS